MLALTCSTIYCGCFKLVYYFFNFVYSFYSLWQFFAVTFYFRQFVCKFYYKNSKCDKVVILMCSQYLLLVQPVRPNLLQPYTPHCHPQYTHCHLYNYGQECMDLTQKSRRLTQYRCISFFINILISSSRRPLLYLAEIPASDCTLFPAIIWCVAYYFLSRVSCKDYNSGSTNSMDPPSAIFVQPC